MQMQHAIFVDAGYLLSQALTVVSRKASKQRKDVSIRDLPGLLHHLRAEAQKFAPDTRLLRTYWYDGVGASMTPEQTAIASLPDLHFRGGTLHNKRQKGVDGRIVHDLFELANERSICDALIVTGDGDLSVGIEFAQRRGLRVAILGIEDQPNGVMPSRHPELNYLADALLTMSGADIMKFFAYQPVPTQAPAAASAAPTVVPTTPPVQQPAVATKPQQAATPAIDQAALEGIADAVAGGILPANLPATLNKAGGVLADTDRQLLAEARKVLGRVLTTGERNYLREAYRRRVTKATP